MTLRTVSQEALTGTLMSLSSSQGVTLRTNTDEVHQIPLADMVRLSTGEGIAARGSSDATLSLSDGGLVHGTLGKSNNDVIAFTTVDLGRLAIPLESVVRIDTPRAQTPAYRNVGDPFKNAGRGVTGQRSTPPQPQLDASYSSRDEDDHILLTNGDTIGGFIESFGSNGISIETETGLATLPIRHVVSAALASPAAPARKNPYCIATLRRSGRILLTDLKIAGTSVKGQLPNGETINIEAERIVQIEFVGGRWEWLATHQPISFEHTPMLALGWEYVVNHNVLGGRLAVDGAVYEHGIGVHSRANLTYDLRGAYRTFVTSFGMDDDSGPLADVDVRIRVDGRVRFERDHVRRGQDMQSIRLDVQGADRIELIVGFGGNGDIQDRFNWIEPALIR